MSAPVIEREHEVTDELVDQEHVFEVVTTDAGTFLRSTWWNQPSTEDEV